MELDAAGGSRPVVVRLRRLILVRLVPSSRTDARPARDRLVVARIDVGMRMLFWCLLGLGFACAGGGKGDAPAPSAQQEAPRPDRPASADAPAKAPTALVPPGRGLRARPLDPSATASLSLTGDVVGGLDYTDGTGHHLLVLTQVLRHGEDTQSAELYAYDWQEGSSWTQLWKIQDFVKDCPVDVTAEFVGDATAVADNDQDGTAETLVLYRLACRGDVSPAEQKLLVHEGATKWALRGMAGLQAGTDSTKASYTKDFPGAPAATLAWAEQVWDRFAIEHID